MKIVYLFFGLKAINKTPIAPFQILFEKLNIQNNYNLGDLIFKIAPRINAAGRLESASMATNFLISNRNNSERNLLKIESINEKRKTIDEQITAQALDQLNKQSIDDLPILCIHQTGIKEYWGIVYLELLKNIISLQ